MLQPLLRSVTYIFMLQGPWMRYRSRVMFKGLECSIATRTHAATQPPPTNKIIFYQADYLGEEHYGTDCLRRQALHR